MLTAFYARDIHEARGAADERATRERKFGNGLQSAFRDRARTIANAFSPLQKLLDNRVVFDALQFVEGRNIGIGIVEVDDEADRAQVLAPVVHEEATTRAIVERPPHRVQHKAPSVPLSRELPQL